MATILLCSKTFCSLAYATGNKRRGFCALARIAGKEKAISRRPSCLADAPNRARGSGPSDGRQRDADIQAEDGEAVLLVARNVDRVQLHGAEIVSGHRERRDKEPAVVVSRTVDCRQGAAKPPALAELELVSRPSELRHVGRRIPVKTGLDEPCAALVLMECVAQAEPGVDLVESLAANALPVGVVREAV